MTVETLLTIAVTALVTGASTGAGSAVGVWIVTKHLIARVENNGKEKKEQK